LENPALTDKTDYAVQVDKLLQDAEKFKLMELPGQPRSMHMGTYYIVSGLAEAVAALRRENKILTAKIFQLEDQLSAVWGGE
jgi:hypothetical protein